MQLEGSCHCGQVSFRLESAHPYPFNLCYCSICRKTAGGGGYAINLGGEFATLEVSGAKHTRVYQAKVTDPKSGETVDSPAKRHFSATAAARSGSGTRAGRSWCTPSLRPSTLRCRYHRSGHIS